jgi:hypothetical protein
VQEAVKENPELRKEKPAPQQEAIIRKELVDGLET